jgi:hypothetical protein
MTLCCLLLRGVRSYRAATGELRLVVSLLSSVCVYRHSVIVPGSG